MTAADVSLAGNYIARLDVFHGRPDFLYDPHELVADDQGRPEAVGSPVVPPVDMHVGSTDTRLLDPDDNVVLAAAGTWTLFESHWSTGSRKTLCSATT